MSGQNTATNKTDGYAITGSTVGEKRGLDMSIIDCKQEAKRVDDTSTINVTYFGYAEVGSVTSSAVWRIKKVDETSGLVETFADGNSNFDNVWDNRVSLTYS